MSDEPIRGKVQFDLDAFERRLERQRVIEFSDVDFLIEILRETNTKAERLEAENRQLQLEAIDRNLAEIQRTQQYNQELSQYHQSFSELKADYEAMRDRWHVANLTITVGPGDSLALKAAAHFFHCRACGEGSEPCEEGLGYARALGLVKAE